MDVILTSIFIRACNSYMLFEYMSGIEKILSLGLGEDFVRAKNVVLLRGKG
jgi:hypothetical protein